ncbi:gamma carbonic anhydrase family protein [Sphingomonas abietis]|uniref:Gamma carbonic anhydrase family protein n=1 Tax=Sphingomonas abietis TaxID=3012344 RepID=A0ABY7NJS7_9SPHN|nr:gamma carbonic anhydrase family protein [Sphingomonas abietis]WBO21215.1 gamma carbonic anhydrase family protein [Sphingomonas abietis]
MTNLPAKPAGGKIFALGDLRPRLAEGVFVAPGSVLIGDVAIGEGSSIWFNCTLRADVEAIRIGARSNVQDGSVVHADPGAPTVIGDDVLVGHMAMLHGCTIADGGFVGMGATLLNGSTVESDGMLGAGALLTGGKTVGAGELWAGRPAKFVRTLSEAQIAEMRQGAMRYAENARRYLRDLRPL